MIDHDVHKFASPSNSAKTEFTWWNDKRTDRGRARNSSRLSNVCACVCMYVCVCARKCDAGVRRGRILITHRRRLTGLAYLYTASSVPVSSMAITFANVSDALGKFTCTIRTTHPPIHLAAEENKDRVVHRTGGATRPARFRGTFVRVGLATRIP